MALKYQKAPCAKVKYIDGIYRYYDKRIGFCNNNIHRGFLTTQLYKEHKCSEKNCIFFQARENHPYILMQVKKQKAKEIKKTAQNNEREIMKFANDILPVGIKPIFCKHLYDSTFLLAIHSTFYCNGKEIYNIMQYNSKIRVYVKFISERQVANIEYTYMSLLPEDMKVKAKKYKEKR